MCRRVLALRSFLCPELLTAAVMNVVFHALRRLMSELQSVGDSLAVASPRLLEHMGIQVQRGTYDAVAHISRDRHHVHSLEYKQTRVQVTQGVYIFEGHSHTSAVALQPLKRCLRIHRLAVPLREQSVVLHPLCPEPSCFDSLLRSEPPQQVHYYLGHLRYTLGASRLGSVRVDTLLRGVLRRTSDVDEVIFKVDVLPLKSQHLTSTESAVYRKHEVELILHRLIVQIGEQRPHLIQREYLLFELLLLRHEHSPARIVAQHTHSYRVCKHVADEAQVVDRCLARERFACGLVPAVYHHICDETLNVARSYLVDPLVSQCRIDTLGELFHSCVGSWSEVDLRVLLEPLLRKSLELYRRGYLSPHALFLEQHRHFVDFPLYLPGSHSRLGIVAPVLVVLLAVDSVTAGDSYFIRTVFSFSDSRHI